MAILRGKDLGEFGALGGLMRVDVVPSPDRASVGLMKLGGYLENTAAPMRAAKAIAKADMKEHFLKDQAPSGDEWVPLDPEYMERKSRMKGLRTHASDILTLTRKMESAATSEAAWVIVGNSSLFFKASVLPAYWQVHQYGSEDQGNVGLGAFHRGPVDKEGKRDSLGSREGRRDPATGKVKGPHESLDIGRGRATPERPFIGLSKEAIAQVAGVFDLWFDEGVNLAISSVGTVQERVGGRFTAKLFPRF